ncbi:MAG: sulfotransferase [Acidobacteriota bacterium]
MTGLASMSPSMSLRAVRAAARAAAAIGGRPRLEPAALLRAARRRARLDDFGAGAWRDGLERLCHALETEARLHPLGRWIVREQLIGHLVTRLRLQATLEAHPRLRTATLAAPVVVITGMQRTGTTKLQRLLAADPDAGALLSWQAVEPVPDPRRSRDDAGRIARARRAERALRWMAPEFFAIHPVEHRAPEEDVLLLDPTFHSTTAEAMWHVPSFSRWLEAQDHREAYETLRLLLVILQEQQPRRWWVLKTPHHLEFLEALHAVIPEARVVWTHRDPLTTVPSFCSMVTHGRRIFSDAVDPHSVGAQWSAKVARMVERGLAFRAAHETPVLDISYDDLLDDPLATIERIYAFAGLSLETPARSAMEQALRVQVQHRYGIHRYHLDDFGLDAASLAQGFGAYRERFGFAPTR